MNKFLITILLLLSFTAFGSDKNYSKKKNHEKHHPNEFCIFDVVPLNSPVKESVARFLIKTPDNFDNDEVSYYVKNSGRIFEKVKMHQRINLVDGSEGKELRISVSKLPPGFYQLFVKIRDKKNKDHHFKTKFKDHAMFVVDSPLQVPAPDPKLNDKTIGGIDSDGDGIRDDIQRWINEKFSTQPKVKMAMREVAMGRQLDLLSVGNKEQSILASSKVLNDVTCLDAIVGIEEGAKLERELESKLLNTKDRLYADIKSNANFSGQLWSLPSTPEDKKALCSFNPDSF